MGSEQGSECCDCVTAARVLHFPPSSYSSLSGAIPNLTSRWSAYHIIRERTFEKWLPCAVISTDCKVILQLFSSR